MPGRFAPTPSGRMHIGNIYAMLGAWLSARSSNDAIYLRIEDIDEPRVVPGAADLIMDDLQWLGLDWDGAPVYQSARHPLYEDALRTLQRLTIDDSGAVTADATGNATPLIYPCFCSRADIRAASAPQEGDRFMIYPGTCRRLAETNPDEVRARLAQGRRHSLRIAMPASNSTIAFEDRVFGHQEFNVTHEISDSVVRRADGLFSYQLVVVVDDLAMGVDDIVRGRDLLRSNALQIWIRQALTGSTDYSYAHLPLIDNASGQRLAKREKSLDMGILRKHGVTPERVIGYCAWLLGLQGDPHSTHPQPMSVQEALTEFSWAKVRTDTADRSLDPQAFNTYFGL
ncbi:glutamyl-Q tRNA(Asp) synthetase [Bifidobacterium dentium]|uniref:Glutamyl-Q tRNA(Asp) synthetase GltX n=1 Tax=Bifidobacterium dentium (strain ATCC 27534 / DSM 20436 / JCM 1195 / Bd1) TaxID=401473 RepID=D2Q6N6_BIFDB|nr:glutamyl-Q tRNA(Asp) synthetase [Bifidobacterium dentium]ADB10577.1 Glutamyl-Q tRNA(Asp) synthetase GltX [Bifidobacterium dentium Bd1]BAQ27882.1 putative tRNA synthase [Bifidobacterium dentium JCM 1195 = DSM 20436]SEC27838.1 glutamyl-tRNA synthetase [Bifidobacterium dentium JCM 1195 = DSM 20436]VEG24551.1 glutamyl-Q tRNA(Asp) synthetase GltX [Bifidobacterium dentium]